MPTRHAANIDSIDGHCERVKALEHSAYRERNRWSSSTVALNV